MKSFKVGLILILITVFLFLSISVSAEVFTRFVTSGTFGSQTNEDTLNNCDSSFSSTYNSAFYDYFTIDNTDLPPTDKLVSIDYCIRGQGDINVGFNTEHLSYFNGNGSEQCYHANAVDYLNLGENIYLHNGYGLFGGALNTDSSTDCLYVKINTLTPTPTNTPTLIPTLTPTPTKTPTPTSTSTPTPTPTNTSTPTPTFIPIPTNTLTPTITPTIIRSVDPTPTTTFNVSTPVCNDQKPESAPFLLLATSSGPNSITLNWLKAKGSVSYYLVTFGTKPGEQLYGNPNVGGSDATAYTINNLSGGKNYYFKVRAGNGCMPGDYSNEVIGRLTGGYVTGIPENFAHDVLGATTVTLSQPLPIKSISNISQVKAKKTKYIFPIIITIIIVGITYLFGKKILRK
jgi:hypothetical protein